MILLHRIAPPVPTLTTLPRTTYASARPIIRQDSLRAPLTAQHDLENNQLFKKCFNKNQFSKTYFLMISVFNFTSSSFMLVLHFEFWKIKYHELMIDTFNNYVKCHYANSHYVECHSHTSREYLRNHSHYMYYFVKAGMQTKKQGQK